MLKNLSRSTTTIVFICFFSCCFGQLTTHTATYLTTPDTVSGLNTISLSITFDDISDLGRIQISAYDETTGTFLLEVSGTRAELIANGMLLSDQLLVPFFPIEPDKQYRFDINSYNVEDAYILRSDLITTF
jgi:hypothetical protein